jgi:hypothetical protein
VKAHRFPDYDNLSDEIRAKGDKMKANLIKLFVLAGILVLAVIVIGGINTTSADVPAQGKPPTVALPTRVGTKPPTLTATPTKPGAQPQVGSTPVAPLKGRRGRRRGGLRDHDLPFLTRQGSKCKT